MKINIEATANVNNNGFWCAINDRFAPSGELLENRYYSR